MHAQTPVQIAWVTRDLIEIAHIPSDIRAFFDYIKQEQQ